MLPNKKILKAIFQLGYSQYMLELFFLFMDFTLLHTTAVNMHCFFLENLNK
jgi:hypothetical protein